MKSNNTQIITFANDVDKRPVLSFLVDLATLSWFYSVQWHGAVRLRKGWVKYKRHTLRELLVSCDFFLKYILFPHGKIIIVCSPIFCPGNFKRIG